MTVEESWPRIVSWLERNAPATAAIIAPPASAAALAGVQARFPYPWPEDLTAWYRLQNGAETDTALWSGVLPGWSPLSLDSVVETAEMYDGMFEDLDDRDNHDPEAGGFSLAFLPAYVPIGDNGCACTLFVDTRPGPLSGCVRDFDRDDGATHGPKWDSVTDMLDDLAAALERGGTCDGWTPRVDGDQMDWLL